MWSVFSPYRSPYTLNLEALQNVIAEVLSVLGNLFIDRDDQDLVALVNDDHVILINSCLQKSRSLILFRRRNIMVQRNGTIDMSIRVIIIHFYIIF